MDFPGSQSRYILFKKNKQTKISGFHGCLEEKCQALIAPDTSSGCYLFRICPYKHFFKGHLFRPLMQREQHAQRSAATKEKPGRKGTRNTQFQTSLLPNDSKNDYETELEIKMKGCGGGKEVRRCLI